MKNYLTKKIYLVVFCFLILGISFLGGEKVIVPFLKNADLNLYFQMRSFGVSKECSWDRLNCYEDLYLKNNLSLDLNFQDIAFLCKSFYDQQAFFLCYSGNLESFEKKDLIRNVKLKYGQEEKYLELPFGFFEGKRFYVLNDSLIMEDEQKEVVQNYLKNNIEGYNFTGSSFFEVSLYVLAIFVLFITLYPILKYLIKNPFNFSLKGLIQESLNSFFGVFGYNSFSKFIYISTFFLAIFTLFFFKSLFIFIGVSFSLMFLISRLGIVFEIFSTFFSKIFKLDFKYDAIKNIYLLNNFLVVVFIIFFIKFGWVETLTLLILSNIFFSYYLSKKKMSISEIFSLKEKIVFFSLLIITVFVLFVFYGK